MSHASLPLISSPLHKALVQSQSACDGEGPSAPRPVDPRYPRL